MILSVVRLTRWELFKLRRRWMPWILLGIVILIAQTFLWGTYNTYRTADIGEVLKYASFGGRTAADIWECREIEHPVHVCEDQERGEQLYRKFERSRFILPNGLSNSLGLVLLIGVIFVPILAASAMGAEYGWGTLRAILTRGTGRRQLLAAKFVAVMLLVVAGLLILSLTSVASSLTIAWLTLSDGFGLADAGKWSTVWVVFGKTVYSLAPYMALALFFSVLTSSAAMGTALVLGYYFIELFVADALFYRFDWFSYISDFLLGTNIAGWMEGTEAHTVGTLSQIPLNDVPGNLHAFFVLLAYIVVPGAAASWLLQRRDIAGGDSAGVLPYRVLQWQAPFRQLLRLDEGDRSAVARPVSVSAERSAGHPGTPGAHRRARRRRVLVPAQRGWWGQRGVTEMATVLNLTGWEWFKLRHRWIPWILLCIVTLIAQGILWGTYISYRTTDLSLTMVSDSNPGGGYSFSLRCRDFEAGHVFSPPEGMDEDVYFGQIERHRDFCENLDEEEKRFREDARQSFVLPSSLANSLGIGHTIGVMLILILASSAMGVEYGWGTLRTALTRGAGRWRLLGSKVIALVLIGAVGLLILSLTIVASSLIAAWLTLGEGGGLADTGEWPTVAVMFGKAVYGLAPYVLLALFFAVLTSSAGAGTAISLGYYLAETITVAILINLFDWFDSVTSFLLGHNIAGWMSEPGVEPASVNAVILGMSDLPGTLHAFIVLLAYMVVLGSATLWLFQRRDISGARGE